MSDPREAIIVRMLAIVSAVSGVETAARNRIEFDDTQLPAVAVLEGDEEVAPDSLTRTASRQSIVTMTPQVYIREDGEEVGTSLNALRDAIKDAIKSDAQLSALTLNGRGVRYAGMQSTLHAGRSMVGAYALMFTIKYQET